MTIFTAADIPPYPPVDPLGDDDHLPRLVFPAPVLDPALRSRPDATPATVHIRRKEAA